MLTCWGRVAGASGLPWGSPCFLGHPRLYWEHRGRNYSVSLPYRSITSVHCRDFIAFCCRSATEARDYVCALPKGLHSRPDPQSLLTSETRNVNPCVISASCYDKQNWASSLADGARRDLSCNGGRAMAAGWTRWVGERYVTDRGRA